MSGNGSGKYGVFRDIPDGTSVQKSNVTDFWQKVQRPDPGYLGRNMLSHGKIETAEGRDIFRSRYRSGSFTETHFTPGNDKQPHSAYHYSVRDQTVYAVNPGSANATRASHKEGSHLFSKNK